MKPKLLDLFCGAGVDIQPYAMVEYIYAKIRRIALPRLWKGSQGSNEERDSHKPSVPSLRGKASGYSETEQLGKPRASSSMAWWHPYRIKWLSFDSSPVRQPLSYDGRWQGASI